MNCPKCNTVNQEGAKFCAKCGAALPQASSVNQVPTDQAPSKPSPTIVFFLSSLITFFLFLDLMAIPFLLWGYFYRIGLSLTPPHYENLGQSPIVLVFILLLPLSFIFSKFLVTKFFGGTRPAVKLIIVITVIFIIVFWALIRFVGIKLVYLL